MDILVFDSEQFGQQEKLMEKHMFSRYEKKSYIIKPITNYILTNNNYNYFLYTCNNRINVSYNLQTIAITSTYI